MTRFLTKILPQRRKGAKVFLWFSFAPLRLCGSTALLLCFTCVNPGLVSAQTPEILKVDPPSWWSRSSVNPVRLMIRGSNFQGARVQVIGPGLRVVGTPKINERGTYIFVDVFIAPNAPPGERSISVTTPRGSARAPFEVLGPLNRAGRFQGFS